MEYSEAHLIHKCWNVWPHDCRNTMRGLKADLFRRCLVCAGNWMPITELVQRNLMWPRKLISAVGDGRPIMAMSKAVYSAMKQQAPQTLLGKDHEGTPVMLRSAEPTLKIGRLWRLTTTHLHIIMKWVDVPIRIWSLPIEWSPRGWNQLEALSLLNLRMMTLNLGIVQSHNSGHSVTYKGILVFFAVYIVRCIFTFCQDMSRMLWFCIVYFKLWPIFCVFLRVPQLYKIHS